MLITNWIFDEEMNEYLGKCLMGDFQSPAVWLYPLTIENSWQLLSIQGKMKELWVVKENIY